MKKIIAGFLVVLSVSSISLASLKSEVVTEGTGPKAKPEDTLLINYQLWLQDESKPDGKGKLIEKNLNASKPSALVLDEKKILAGLFRSLIDQKEGSHLRIILPAEMAFGSKGEAEIPPNTGLIFEIDIRKVTPKSGEITD